MEKTMEKTRAIREVNATLPEPLAEYMGRMTGEGGDYATPEEFIHNLLIMHMEMEARERVEIRALLEKSLRESTYAPLTPEDFAELRRIASE